MAQSKAQSEAQSEARLLEAKEAYAVTIAEKEAALAEATAQVDAVCQIGDEATLALHAQIEAVTAEIMSILEG